MTATIDFLTGSAKDVLLVPNAALRFRPTRGNARADAQGSGSARRGSEARRRRPGEWGSAARSGDGCGSSAVRLRPVGHADLTMLWYLDDQGQARCRARSNRAYGWATHRSRERGLKEGMQIIIGVTQTSRHRRSIESLPAAAAADVTATAGRLLKRREPMAAPKSSGSRASPRSIGWARTRCTRCAALISR